MNDKCKPKRGYIKAIIVDGVRYDKVKAKTEFVCEENKDYAILCGGLIDELCECWKRKEE